MKRELLILLAAATLTVAMVPRLRRAVDLDEHNLETAPVSSNKSEICMPQTPCAWTIYKTKAKILDTQIENLYCICKTGLVCMVTEDDSSAGAFIHRCRPPTKTKTRRASDFQ